MLPPLIVIFIRNVHSFDSHRQRETVHIIFRAIRRRVAVVGSKQIIFFFFTVFGFVIFSIVLVTWGEPVWELALSITDALSVCLRLLFILLFNSFSLHDSLLISLRCLIKRLLSFPLILLFLFIYMFDWKLFVLP